jgi:ATP-dependent protease HslVU (ClpYQ) ATPase subunit
VPAETKPRQENQMIVSIDSIDSISSKQSGLGSEVSKSSIPSTFT